MKTRIISGVVIAAVLAGVLIPGGYILAGALFVVSLIGFYELTRATGVHIEGKKCNALEACGYVSVTVHYLQMLIFQDHRYYIFSLMFSFFLIMVLYVLSFPGFRSAQAISCFFCFIYAPVNISFVYLLRIGHLGRYLAWIPFIAWVCDTCAYFAGRAFGRHKLTPVLSPKKTVEGAIGGIIGSVLVGAVFGYVLYKNEVHDTGVIMMLIVITFVGSIISQLGDLLASGIKRDHDIKDYGHIIPGHGGIMDRFDSVIFVTPCIYFMAAVMAPLIQ
ncbi:MAG: phosphatidate cytidylyltransferase [Oscillospiraceae bacterium]|nr:phosphatidate cytidylyltransferase [Oscillospiraceae bacterium]